MDRLETREFAYFVTVAEELHFGRAADRLGIAQPPLSRAISRLERRLGVRLFDRTSRSVSLTPAGEAFLDASRDVLAAADAAVRTAQRAARSNRLVVAARPGQGSRLLTTILPRYDRSKDALPVEILFTRQQAAAVRDGTADAGLMCSTEDLTGLQTAELITEAPVALLPAGHPLASRPAVTIGELRRLDTFAEQCPDSSLDQIIDLVALQRLIVVVSDGITGKLGPDVTAVPVTGVPASLLVLGWATAIPRPALAAFISQAKRVTDSLVSHPKAS
jgi:DNA-binding transcriptional LysR family regulator